jgi:hypothetical protein
MTRLMAWLLGPVPTPAEMDAYIDTVLKDWR